MKGKIKGEEGASHIVWNLYLILYIRTNFISACMSSILFLAKVKNSVANTHVFVVIFGDDICSCIFCQYSLRQAIMIQFMYVSKT